MPSTTPITASTPKIVSAPQAAKDNNFTSSLYAPFKDMINGCTVTATPAGYDNAGKPLWKIEVVATDGKKAAMIAPLRAQFKRENFTEKSTVFIKLNQQLGGALSGGVYNSSITQTVPSTPMGGLKTGTSHSTTVYAATTSVPEGENIRKFSKGSRDNATALKNAQLFGVGIPVIAHSGELLDKLNGAVGSLKGVPTLLKKVKKDIIGQYNIVTFKEKGNLGNYLMGGYTGVGEFSKGVALGGLDTVTRIAFPGQWHDQIMAGATQWADEQDTKYYAKIKELGVDTQSTSYTLGNHGAKVASTIATAALTTTVGGKIGVPKFTKPNLKSNISSAGKKIITTAQSNINTLYVQNIAKKLAATEQNSFSKGYGLPRAWNRSKNINPNLTSSKTLARWSDTLPNLTKDQTLLWYKQVKIAAEKTGLSVADVEAHFPTCYNHKGVLDIPLAFRKAVEWKQATKDVKIQYKFAEPYVTPTSSLYIKGLSAQDIVTLLEEQNTAYKLHMPYLPTWELGKPLKSSILLEREKYLTRSLQQEARRRTHASLEVSPDQAARNIANTYELCDQHGIDFRGFQTINNNRIESAYNDISSITPQRAVSQYLERQTRNIAREKDKPLVKSYLNIEPDPTILTRDRPIDIRLYKPTGVQPIIKLPVSDPYKMPANKAGYRK
jgi:hypothetical protein